MATGKTSSTKALSKRKPFRRRVPMTAEQLQQAFSKLEVKPRGSLQMLLDAVNGFEPKSREPFAKLPPEVKASVPALAPALKRFHGAKVQLGWFPGPARASPCADKFGYLSSPRVRAATRLPFDAAHRNLLDQLGDLMGDTGREAAIGDSTLPAGFTYVGQFVDHDITLDVSSSLNAPTDANTVPNMRSPALDLDSVYGRGPALDPFLYVFPSLSGNPTAIKLALGSNRNTGPGGPGGNAGFGGMQAQTDFDVPRMHNPANPSQHTLTAVIGDPRNDENLIVSQFHHTMLRFHNQVVDVLLAGGSSGDLFVEAKRIVTHHYQWAVVNDYLRRICGAPAVNAALTTVVAPVGSPFRMPVEFAVAAYRFGHSQVRENYWLNFNFPNQPMAAVFNFIRPPNLPVLSKWVIDFNAFFDTGVPVPVNNKARKIDSVLAPAIESLPGFTGLLAVLAQRNLRRGLALGLPSGQGMAKFFGLAPLTVAQLTNGLPANEVAVLNANGGVLLKKTPLWYYVLREAAEFHGGEQLGPVGARIVAETFVRMLRRDGGSFLNAAVPFVPSLPSTTPGDFTFADLVIFAGVTQP